MLTCAIAELTPLRTGTTIAPLQFGKGVYFADSVSKSANYCATSSSNPTGLLALSEVALGNMHECKHADSDLPKTMTKGKHAAFGMGRSAPDKSDVETLDNGTLVPLGKIGPSGVDGTSLEYNEFIVCACCAYTPCRYSAATILTTCISTDHRDSVCSRVCLLFAPQTTPTRST